MRTEFWLENLKGKDHSEDVGVEEGRIRSMDLRDLREVGRKGLDWIHLAQDRDQWRAFVYTVMNLWVL
jgi:hypothetical protein